MEKIVIETGSKAFSSVPEFIAASDTVVICTPISVTSQIIDDISRLAKNKINIVEISSLKNQSVLALRKRSGTIFPVSVHPMFGPDVETFEGKTIIVVPVIKQQREEELAKELFPGANIIILDSETHDRSMALILSLPYFMNSVFMKCMANQDVTLLRKIGGPTFKPQLALAHCILEKDNKKIK
jgi:prephenate dehydrogenase